MFTEYLNRGIAKRLIQNRQSTPRHADMSTPRAGWIQGTHERFVDCWIPWI